MSQDTPTSLDDPQASLIAFWIGPAQPFIAGARSLRDLWLGSVILSWLTDEAMKAIRGEGESGTKVFLTPDVLPDDNAQSRAGSLERPLLGRPNRFVAVVKHDHKKSPQELAAQAVEKCKCAWDELAKHVHKVVDKEVVSNPAHGIAAELRQGWAERWNDQVKDFLHVEAAWLPVAACDRATLQRLLGLEWDAENDHAEKWGRIELVLRLIDARKTAGHFPAYRLRPGDVPQKCSILGSFEMMGPAEEKCSKKFWGQMSAQHVRYRGTGINKRERLCAISLIKRFGWVAYLQNQFRSNDDKASFPDTATLAAAHWLANGQPIVPKDWHDWSGQWLHWTRPEPPKRDLPKKTGADVDEDAEWNAPEDAAIPEKLWPLLQRKRQPKADGWPPAYYAILTMDVDKMHRWLQGDMLPGMAPEKLLPPLSRALGQFARSASFDAVQVKHRGRLIYAGGDDILAFLPLEDIIPCAILLNKQLGVCWDAEPDLRQLPIRPNFSAGIAIVHFKEDLRFALRQAREAEEAAKDREGDAVGIAVLRRSGEHTRAVVPWDLLPEFKATFFEAFRKQGPKEEGASDRWLYHLRAEEPTLRELTDSAVRAEMKRLADRVESSPRVEPEAAVGLWDRYRSAMDLRRSSGETTSDLADYLTLAQTMSFLTRGKD